MHIVCLGPTDTGEPTILLEAGGGLDYSIWGQILPAMQSTHRLCAYDRAGLGMSEPPAEASRTTADQVADLRALLDASDVSGPFVIGAHSYGATVATLFTQAYPDDVVGLVFVDPQGPRVTAGWRDALPAPSAGEPTSVTSWRDELDTFETDPSLNEERVELRTSLAAAAAALDAPGPLFGDRPVVVLSAEDVNVPYSDLPPELAATFGDIWAAGQQELADEFDGRVGGGSPRGRPRHPERRSAGRHRRPGAGPRRGRRSAVAIGALTPPLGRDGRRPVALRPVGHVDMPWTEPMGSRSHAWIWRRPAGMAAARIARCAATRARFVRPWATMSQVETVVASQPRSLAICRANRRFRSSVPSSSLTSAMSVLSSMTRSARRPGCHARMSMTPRSP